MQKCQLGVDLVKEMEQKLYEMELVTTSKREIIDGQPVMQGGDPGLVRLESSLLHLASLDTICQGIFYMFPVKVSCSVTIVR